MNSIPQPFRRHRALVFGSRRTVARSRPSCTMARSASFAVVTDQKLQRVDIWVTWGHTFLCLSPDLAQSSQNKDRSCSYQTTGFLHEDITLAYSVFLEELSSDLFSVIGLFGNSDFLSLLAGFSNRTRRTYLATSTLRTPNTARESL